MNAIVSSWLLPEHEEMGQDGKQEGQQQTHFSSLFPKVREIRNQSIALNYGLNLIVTILQRNYIFLNKILNYVTNSPSLLLLLH